MNMYLETNKKLLTFIYAKMLKDDYDNNVVS
jgi:hypothetical protein